MPRLKVCGVTDAAFAVEAARRDVDYIGFVFADGSPRRVSAEFAQDIISAARGPRFVGVFSGIGADEVISTAARIRLHVVQLHGGYGDSDVAAVKAAGFEVWRLYEGGSAVGDALLLDGSDGRRRGGTGRCADWALVNRLKRAGCRVVLAGGISVGNIAAAIATGADIIDVNSSLEVAPGVKSVELLDSFLDGFVVGSHH